MGGAIRALGLVALAALAAAGAEAAPQQKPAPPGMPAAPQADRFAGRIVSEVRVLIEDTPTDNASLRALVDVPIGAPLSLEVLRQIEQRIAALPQYEDVVVTGEEQPDGRVSLSFRLEPRHPIDRLEFYFVGAVVVPAEVLDRRVRDQFGGVPPGDRIADVEESVRELLAEEGYRSATITPERVVRHDPDRATLRFAIDAGPPTIVANVQVNGESPYPITEILKRTGAQDGATYREARIETVLGQLRDEMSTKGYYAAVAQQIPEFLPGAQVALTLVVNAGPIVALHVEPPNALPPGDIDEYIPIRRERAVDDDLLEDAQARIITALQSQGYIEPTVTFRRDTDTPGQQLITFRVERGRRYRVDHVEAPTGLVLPPATLVKLLGIASGDVLTLRDLGEGLARIAADYRSRGFFDVQAREEHPDLPGRSTPAEAWVVIQLKVAEGPRAAISGIEFALDDAPRVPASALRPILQSQPGQPYVEAVLGADRQRLLAEYERRGFPEAAVQIERRFSDDRTAVALAVTAREGPQRIVREIIVVGNERIDTDEVLREMTLHIGDPLSDEARYESRRRLLSTSSYRNVTITPEPPPPGDTGVRLIVSVEEAPATAVAFGGGLEVRRRPRGGADRFEVAPRAFVELSRRNIGGRNRSLNFFSRGSLQLADVPAEIDDTGRPNDFAEYRVTATYREQNAFRTDTDVLIGVMAEQALRTTFNFTRRSANAELLHRLTPALNVSGRYALEFNRIFLFEEQFVIDDPLLVDRVFPQVRLSLLAGGLLWDRRDSPLAPTRGTLVVADHEIALTQLGSEVGFVKTFYQVSFFRPISADRRTVFASRLQLGAARGVAREVTVLDEDGDPIVGPDGQPVTSVIDDLPASHRFFAGGSTTVRGFQLDRLGSRRLNPDGSINEAGVLNEDGLSNGGHALLLLNLEMRTIVGRLFGRSFAVAGFLDAGNVFARARHLALGDLRGSLGFGVRYDSPLGPVRLDFGFKMDRLNFLRSRERGWEYHLSIGEAF
jgi:outer membrane protein insertion porin family